MEYEKNRLTTKSSKDYYRVLNVRFDATLAQIEEAYHQLSEEYGPNASLSSSDSVANRRIFKDISDAYEMLRDPIKRRDYDRTLAHSRPPISDVRALWAKASQASVADAAEKPPQIQALSLEIVTEVTLKEAVKGTKKFFDISDPTPCEDCASMKPVTRIQCGTCRGLGYFNRDRKEGIDLPAGMYDGMEIRKQQLGRYDLRAGKHGDLVLKIKVKADPNLSLKGKDITCNVPVTLYEAILGSQIEVPTATGQVMMKIQPCTQPGRVYRLKGLGLAGGDQLVAIQVVLPTDLSAEDLAHFRKLREICREPNPRQKTPPK